MTLPKWNDPNLKAGTRIRTALWLASDVGVGNIFTKGQHRDAFRDVTQADRRLRDLREYGWVIHTSAEDVALKQDEQRLVSIGLPVWERGVRRSSMKEAPTAKTRRAALADSDYQCQVCGIAGGERYIDAPHVSAVLSAHRRVVNLLDGQSKAMFVAECKRCSAADEEKVIDLPAFLAEVRALHAADQLVFAGWAARGRRSALDKAWTKFRRLPTNAQAEVRETLQKT